MVYLKGAQFRSPEDIKKMLEIQKVRRYNTNIMLSRISRSLATKTAYCSSIRCRASTLVISEPSHGSVTPGQTQSAVTAAQSFRQDIELLVVGKYAPTEIS